MEALAETPSILAPRQNGRETERLRGAAYEVFLWRTPVIVTTNHWDTGSYKNVEIQ